MASARPANHEPGPEPDEPPLHLCGIGLKGEIDGVPVLLFCCAPDQYAQPDRTATAAKPGPGHYRSPPDPPAVGVAADDQPAAFLDTQPGKERR